VQIHEVGEHGGLPFFSLEFCPGGSLEDKLGGTPLPPLEAARLLEALARAMQAAHERGIVHRDLKPANVLLTEEGQPKVADFGLAKLCDNAARGPEGAGATRSGAIVGTPSYMAPEQAAGKAISPRTDVYALGAILYECLTGRPPFKAALALDTLLQVMTDDPVPPRQLQPKTPRDLETVCLKCLEKDPDRRYASARDLAEDLRRFREGEPVRARPVGAWERAWRWGRRNPGVASWAAAVVFALLAGTLISSYFAVQASRSAKEAKVALLARDEAIRRNRKTAARVVGFLKDNPHVLQRPKGEIIKAILNANPGLSEEDLREAFPKPPVEESGGGLGGAEEAVAPSPNFLGD
jgi:hypothetical protein